MLETNDIWVVLIKTNQYAGNFERELCAFLTGAVGDCRVGEELVNVAIQKIFLDSLHFEPDDHGCFRPCGIFAEEGDDYNSVSIFFHEKPTVSQLKIMKDRLPEFKKQQGRVDSFENIEFLGFKLFLRRTITEMIKCNDFISVADVWAPVGKWHDSIEDAEEDVVGFDSDAVLLEHGIHFKKEQFRYCVRKTDV